MCVSSKDEAAHFQAEGGHKMPSLVLQFPLLVPGCKGCKMAEVNGLAVLEVVKKLLKEFEHDHE